METLLLHFLRNKMYTQVSLSVRCANTDAYFLPIVDQTCAKLDTLTLTGFCRNIFKIRPFFPIAIKIRNQRSLLIQTHSFFSRLINDQMLGNHLALCNSSMVN